MNTPVAMLALTFLLDPRANALLADRYSQLPSEAFCEFAYKVAEEDCQALCAQLYIVGGWSGSRLREAEAESCRIRQVLYAAWWVRWSRATVEQRDEWAGILAGHIGAEAFYAGSIPLPLSLR